MRRRPSSTCCVAAISASSWFAFAPDPVSSSQESKAMSEVQSYIAGEWCSGNAAELTVVNPSTEEVVGRGRGVDAMQLDRALAAADEEIGRASCGERGWP